MFRWTLGIVAVALLFGMVGFGPRAVGQALPTPRGQLGGKEPLEPSPSPPAPPPPIVLPSPAAPPVAPNVAQAPTATATESAPPTPGRAASAAGVVAAAQASTVTLLVQRGNDAALASGWAFDAAGRVATAAPAVAGADRVEAIAPDGRRHAATVVAADAPSGVAALEAPGLALPPLPLAAADATAGETVYAAGSAGEGLAGTVTRGMVAAAARTLPDAYAATPLLQHDAAVAPTMAGGPLLNAAGEVVGMTVVVGGDRQGFGPPGFGEEREDAAAAPARSFAVPVSTLRAVVPALVGQGRVARSWFGVGVRPVTAEEASKLGLPEIAGVVVAAVAPDGPAATGGVEEGDVIVAVAGEAVTPERGLAAILAEHGPGETVEVRLLRRGLEQTADVTLGEAPQGG